MKHTHPNDDYITFWRPNNHGYCYAIPLAGKYENTAIKPGYHDNESTIPVSEELVANLANYAYDGDSEVLVLLNHAVVLKQLGLKKSGNCIKRI